MINHKFIRWLIIILFLISSVGSCKSWFKYFQKKKTIIPLREDTVDIRHRTLTTYQKYYVYDLLYIIQQSCPLHFKSLTLHILTFLGSTPLVPGRLLGHRDKVNIVCLSVDDRWLASADWTGTVLLWSVESGQRVATVVAHTRMINQCVFSPDTAALLTTSEDTTIKQWAVPTGALLSTCTGHPRGVVSCTLSTVDAGRFILSVGGDIRQWQRATGQCVRVFTTPGLHFSRWGQFWNQDEYVLSGGIDEDILTWSVRTGQCIRRFTGGHTARGTICAVAPNQQFILSVGNDRRVCVWGLTTGDRVQTFDEHTHSPPGRFGGTMLAGCFLADSSRVVSGDDAHIVLVWRVADGVVLHRFLQYRASFLLTQSYWLATVEYITVCAVAPDGYILDVTILDVTSGHQLRTMERTGTVHTLAVSSDGRFMVLGSDNGSLYIRDLK